VDGEAEEGRNGDWKSAGHAGGSADGPGKGSAVTIGDTEGVAGWGAEGPNEGDTEGTESGT